MNLPPGVTLEQMQRIAAFFAQNAVAPPRPSGTLQPNQIRGVDPRYQYAFREYPKALNPPPITVTNEAQERTYRLQWQQPLPWNSGGPEDRMMVETYYATRVYPIMMNPPQVVVYSIEEEEAKIAAWQAEGGTVEPSSGVRYPRWLFHAEKGGQFVANRDAENALGRGWFTSPKDAMDAAQGIVGGGKSAKKEKVAA